MRRRIETGGPPNPVVLSTIGYGAEVLPRIEEPSVAEAISTAYDLGTSTDALTEQLERCEEALAGAALGVSACVLLESDTRGERVRYLSFRKDGSAWKLFVDSGLEGNPPEQWDSSHVLSVSRELRVLATGKLDDLFAALLKEARRQVREVREGVERAEKFADRLFARNGAR